MPEEVLIVPIREEHIEDLVDVYQEAFQDSASGKMGRRYARNFLSWFMTCEDGIALTAVEGKTVLGFVVGAVMGYQKNLNRYMFWTVFWSLIRRPHLWIKKDIIRNIVARVQVVLGMHSKQVSATGVHYPQPCMSYVGVAVSSKARGKGVGKKFNSTFLNICENSDRIVAVRSTSHEDNVPACRIYVDLGWKEVAKNEAGYIEWLKVFDENK
ncbi:hypothetical protein BMS3Bbin04_00698 [bacterium BMS3Bbin04]|nr:hypothetical protein BMS3Bbin04_00698 [bacterium BMS3Bbin04]